MKNLKEKQFLVNMALSLGQVPDPALVKEIREHKELMDSITPRGDEFGELLAQLAQLKSEVDTVKQVVEVKQQYFKPIDYPKPPTLEELMASVPEEVIEQLVEKKVEEKPIVVKVKEKLSPLIAAASEHITKEVKMEAVSFEPPELDPMMRSLNELRNKIKQLENKITNISSLGPGSGEVNLLKLDDVDTSNIGNNKFLRYNATSAKIEFATVTGGSGIALTDLSVAVDTPSGNGNLVYDNNTGIFNFTPASLANKANISDLTTANVIELTNLYFTNARARQAISVAGAGSYDNTTGIITITSSSSYNDANTYSNVTLLGYITSSSLSGYATNSQLASYATNAQLSSYALTTSLTTANVTELTNLYYTNARAQVLITPAFDKANTAFLAATAAFNTANIGGGGGANLLAVSTAIIPNADSVYDLGTANLRWGTLFLANNTINLGGSLISSDGTGIITISSLGAVLPVNSKVTVDGTDKQIALVGNTGAIATVVPFFTEQLGLNTIATNFTFGANPDDFVFTNFTFSNGSTITQSARALFYF